MMLFLETNALHWLRRNALHSAELIFDFNVVKSDVNLI